MALYLGVHDVCGKLVSHCKVLVQLVSSPDRDSATFFQWWNATNDLVTYLVQFVEGHAVDPRLYNEKGEVLTQARNIEQLVAWILAELQALFEDPNSKTPTETQQLSFSVRDQLRIAIQALGNVTKKFTVMEQQYPQPQPTDYENPYGETEYQDQDYNPEYGEAYHQENYNGEYANPNETGYPSTEYPADYGENYGENYEQEVDNAVLEVSREFLILVTDHANALLSGDHQTVVTCNKQLNALMVELLSRLPNAKEALKNAFVSFQQNCKKYITTGSSDVNLANSYLGCKQTLEDYILSFLPMEHRQMIISEISARSQNQAPSNNQYQSNPQSPEFAPRDGRPRRPGSSEPIMFEEIKTHSSEGEHEQTTPAIPARLPLNIVTTEVFQEQLVQRLMTIMGESCPNAYVALTEEKKLELKRDIELNLNNYVKTKQKVASTQTSAPRRGPSIPYTSSSSSSNLKKKKGDNRLKRPAASLSKLGDSGIPPQGKSLGDAVLTIMQTLYDFGIEFNDNDLSWDQNWKPPFKVPHYTNHVSRKILETNVNKCVDELKCTAESLAIAMVSEPFTEIKSKIASTLVFRKAAVLPHDVKQFAKAQHLRWAKRELLNAIVLKIGLLEATCTQYLMTLHGLNKSDDIETYHLLGLTIQFYQLLMETQDDVETYLEFGKIECNYKRGPFTKIKSAKGASDGVWKDKASYEFARCSMDPFEPCSLNALAVKMTNSTLNKDVLSAFLAGYNSFASAKAVWRKMEDRYCVPKDCPSDVQGQEKFIQLRVARWILDWLKADLHSIDDNVIVSIKGFAEQLKADTWYELSTWVLGEFTSTGRFACEYLPQVRPTVIPIFQCPAMPTYHIFVTYDPADLAEQMTLIDWEIYKKISHFELENQNWSKDKTKVLARNVIDLITRTNHYSYYVTTMIVNTRKHKARVKVLSRFIAVAKHLLEIGNMSGFMGMLTGLSQACVSRLKHTWTKLPTSQQADWKRFEALQDPSSAFKNWRDQMLLIKDPKLYKCIPYIGLFLSDITFMDEGNPIFNEKKEIYFPKFQLITNSIKDLLKYQKSPFEFPIVEPLFTILKKLPSMMINDTFMSKELFALSLEREPRNAELKTLE